MLKVLLYISVMLFLIIPVGAQQPNHNSPRALLLQLKKSNKDTAAVNLLLQLSGYYFLKSPRQPADLDSSFQFASSAESLSNTLTYQRGLGNSYEQISKIFHVRGDTAKGKYLANKAIKTFKANNYLMELGYAYFDLSGYYSFSGNELAERIRIVEQLALPAFQQAGSKIKQADIHKELGDLYQSQGNYIKALSVLKQEHS